MFLEGPGGIGKSPLDMLLKADVIKINPYRMRIEGPRDRKDIYYAHPQLKEDLYAVYQKLGFSPVDISPYLQWFPETGTLFIKVRDIWQFLMLDALPEGIAKAEIFAPAVPSILENPEICSRFGKTSVVILNPANPIATLEALDPIKNKTRENCTRRGDSQVSIDQRVDSIDEEVQAWKQLIAIGAVEIANWDFPEYKYDLEGETETLRGARRAILENCPDLELFFKKEEEIC